MGLHVKNIEGDIAAQEHAATPQVTVIVPVYNCEAFLERCLDSILGQSYQNFEIIAINDGSTDDSLAILQRYGAQHRQLRVLDQANAGQGAGRNRALALARGEYVLFVDADDYIEPVLLEVTVARAEADTADLVHFDWKLLSPTPQEPHRVIYYNTDPFWHRATLEGAECDELLRVQNQFSVTNLYRRSFLEQHGIRFEEGRIYEDNPFVLHTVNRAETVSLVHSPLYTVNPHEASTTRRGTGTEKHYRDHIYAIRRSFALLQRRNPHSAAYLAAYHVKKFGPYYEKRIPRRYKKAYVREFVDALHEADVTNPAGAVTNPPFAFALQHSVFTKQRYAFFHAFVVSKNVVMPHAKRVKPLLRRVKRRVTRAPAAAPALAAALATAPNPQLVCFLGFDARFVGNSRALFEEMMADPRFAHLDIRFVTTAPEVPEAQRLEPGAAQTLASIGQARLVIAESWVPESVKKNPGSTWLQLWHGTPVKRVLFDSHEPEIIRTRPKHKVNKFRDVQRWDYLVTDSAVGADKFATSFLFDRERLVPAGYPRVKALRAADSDAELKRRIRESLGLSAAAAGRRVVLYAPTWRDYNYGSDTVAADLGYRLDLGELATLLGDAYEVVTHEHHYLASVSHDATAGYRDVSHRDIQEVLAVSDVVISDFSSVIFDALALERQVLLYTPDFERFAESRGVYTDVWADLSPLRTDSVAEIVDRVRGGSTPELVLSAELQSKYTYTSEVDLLDWVHDRLGISPRS